MGKEEIARNERCLLFPQCFLLNQKLVSPFVNIYDIASLVAAELGEPKIGLRKRVKYSTFKYVYLSDTQEIGLLFDTLRTATVESATPMELLVIGKEDFVRIFMKAENPEDDADHIKFLRYQHHTVSSVQSDLHLHWQIKVFRSV